MTAPYTPDKLAAAVVKLNRAGATVQRARITPEGEIVIDFAPPNGQPVDPFELVSMKR